jgi:hypothetical protein
LIPTGVLEVATLLFSFHQFYTAWRYSPGVLRVVKSIVAYVWHAHWIESQWREFSHFAPHVYAFHVPSRWILVGIVQISGIPGSLVVVVADVRLTEGVEKNRAMCVFITAPINSADVPAQRVSSRQPQFSGFLAMVADTCIAVLIQGKRGMGTHVVDNARLPPWGVAIRILEVIRGIASVIADMRAEGGINGNGRTFRGTTHRINRLEMPPRWVLIGVLDCSPVRIEITNVRAAFPIESKWGIQSNTNWTIGRLVVPTGAVMSSIVEAEASVSHMEITHTVYAEAPVTHAPERLRTFNYFDVTQLTGKLIR